MFWRPTVAILSVVPALGLTGLFAAYLVLDHDFNHFIRNGLIVLVFAGSWYASLVWMMRSGSARRALGQVRLALKALAVASIVLGGLWAFGYFAPSTNTPGNGLTCEDCPLVSVVRIIDGDTLVSGIGRIRLFGIDAPEVGQRCARSATEELRRLAGSRVRIEDGPRLLDAFGRRLAYLYGTDGDSIDAALIEGGFAVAWTRDGQHVQRLVAAERAARNSGEGCLW